MQKQATVITTEVASVSHGTSKACADTILGDDSLKAVRSKGVFKHD